MFEFEVLGPLRVWRDRVEVDLNAPMLRRVLAVLLCRQGEPVSVSTLIGAAWHGSPPLTARKTLQVYVRRLRQALGDDKRVSFGPAGYALTLEPAELDAARFAGLVGQARDARDDGDLPRAGRLLREAARLWRGPAYADVIDTPLVAEVARRLEEARLLAVEDRARIDLDLGRHAELVPDLMAEIADPAGGRHRERLVGYLMLALHRAGRHVEALETYRQTRSYLAEELGVEPGAALQRLHEAMLRDDARLTGAPAADLVGEPDPDQGPAPAGPVSRRPATGRATAGLVTDVARLDADTADLDADTMDLDYPATRPGARRPRQLPAATPAFTGREAALAALDSLITDPTRGRSAPLAVISGPAGVGKTSLAVHWAYLVVEHFPDGQLQADLRGFDPLRPPVPPGEALARFLRSLGVPPAVVPAGVDEQAAMFRSMTAGRRLLLVLDNASSPEQVRPLLPGTPSVFVLITSRDRMTGLVAREGARPVQLDVTTPAESYAIVASVLGPERAAGDPAGVAELARLCGHLPLALRVVAGTLAARPDARVGETVAALSKAGLGLEGDRPAGPGQGGDGYRRALAALDVSTRLLPAPQRRLFDRLGLHRGPGLDVPGVAALAGLEVREAAVTLERLAAVRLLERPAPGTYRLHDLLRGYAGAGMAAEPVAERRAATERLLNHLWTAVARSDAVVLRGTSTGGGSGPDLPRFTGPAEATAWLQTQRENLTSAVALAAAEGFTDHAWRGAYAVWRHLRLAGHAEDWIGTFEMAVEPIRHEGPPEVRVTLLTGLAHAYQRNGRYVEALGLHAECLVIRSELGDEGAVARTRAGMALTYERLGRYRDALAQLEAGVATFEALGDGYRAGLARAAMATALGRLGRPEEALRHLTGYLAQVERHGSPLDAAMTYDNLGRTHHLLGDQRAALHWLDRALAAARRHQDRLTESVALADSANVHRVLGGYELALDLHRRAYELTRQWGVRGDQAVVLADRADTLLAAGRAAEAAASYERALAVAGPLGERHQEGRALAGLGRALRGTDPRRSRQALRDALDILDELGLPDADEVRRYLIDG